MKKPWVWPRGKWLPVSTSEIVLHGSVDAALDTTIGQDLNAVLKSDWLRLYRRELYARWKALNQ